MLIYLLLERLKRYEKCVFISIQICEGVLPRIYRSHKSIMTVRVATITSKYLQNESVSKIMKLKSWIKTSKRLPLQNEILRGDYSARNMYCKHGWIITSHSILWDVIIYSCLRYLHVYAKSYMTMHVMDSETNVSNNAWDASLSNTTVFHWCTILARQLFTIIEKVMSSASTTHEGYRID